MWLSGFLLSYRQYSNWRAEHHWSWPSSRETSCLKRAEPGISKSWDLKNWQMWSKAQKDCCKSQGLQPGSRWFSHGTRHMLPSNLQWESQRESQGLIAAFQVTSHQICWGRSDWICHPYREPAGYQCSLMSVAKQVKRNIASKCMHKTESFDCSSMYWKYGWCPTLQSKVGYSEIYLWCV